MGWVSRTFGNEEREYHSDGSTTDRNERSGTSVTRDEDGEIREYSITKVPIIGHNHVDTYNKDGNLVNSQHVNLDKDDNDGGCFLTTACVKFAGLNDDCRELEVLRCFRDSYIRSLPHGKEMLDEYYLNAPRIVSRIRETNQEKKILPEIYSTIEKAVVLIREGNNHEALNCYSAMYHSLQERFGNQA